MKKIFSLIVMMVICAFTTTISANNSSLISDVCTVATFFPLFNIVILSVISTASFSIKGNKFGTQKGNISIKGNKFHASTASAIVWYNGKTQWTYVKKNEEVNVSTPSAAQQSSMNPYTFVNLYKKGYSMQLNKTASGNQVHLKALNQKASIKEAYILVDGNNNIKEVKMRQASGWVTISISNIRQQTLSDATFTFNAKDYPKAEVIDLR